MRKVIYYVGVSLDGCLASADGSFEWLNRASAKAEAAGEDFGMAELFARIDTVVMGRKTYEVMLKFGPGGYPKVKNLVFSRTLPPSTHKGVEVIAADAAPLVAELKKSPGKDIYLCGGGQLAQSLLRHGLVDEIQMGVVPVLVGDGLPCFPAGFPETELDLVECKQYKGGIVGLTYRVAKAAKPEPKRAKKTPARKAAARGR